MLRYLCKKPVSFSPSLRWVPLSLFLGRFSLIRQKHHQKFQTSIILTVATPSGNPQKLSVNSASGHGVKKSERTVRGSDIYLHLNDVWEFPQWRRMEWDRLSYTRGTVPCSLNILEHVEEDEEAESCHIHIKQFAEWPIHWNFNLSNIPLIIYQIYWFTKKPLLIIYIKFIAICIGPVSMVEQLFLFVFRIALLGNSVY